MSDRPDDFAIEPSPSGRLPCGGGTPDDRCRLGAELAGTGADTTRSDADTTRSDARTTRFDARTGRDRAVSALLTLATGGPPPATARAELRTRRPGHFARHQTWLAHH
jgi:hypothetical protein